MPQHHRDVIVIGAGISGLVCAYRLKRLGVDVALLEKSDGVGGVIQSERIDGFLIERGPNSSQGTEELLALVDELGITDELVEGDPKAPAYVCLNGSLHRVPSGPGSLIRSKLLSAGGKLRLLKEPFVRARNSNSEESVASFASRRIGREAAERLVAPFVSGIYAGDSEKLSVQAAFPRLARLESGHGSLFRGMLAKAREAGRARKASKGTGPPARKKRLCSFRNGMAFLPATLASKLGEDLITGCEELRIADGATRIDFERDGNHHQLQCEHVVIATPSRVASRILSPVSEELSSLLGEIDYPPLAILSLAYDTAAIATKLDGFGFLIPPNERMKVLGCVWNSTLFKDRAPEGKALMTVFIGGARNPDAAFVADDDLVSTAHGELRAVLGISNEPRVIAITRYRQSIPQYNLGHCDRVRRIESLLSDLPNLRLIGNYMHGVSTGDCIKNADLAAQEIAGSIEAS